MRLVMVVDIDDTNEGCEATLEEIETVVAEREDVRVRSAGRGFSMKIVAAKEHSADAAKSFDLIWGGS